MPAHPLHEAIQQRDLIAVERLLAQSDIDPNEQDDQGNAPLHVAIEHREQAAFSNYLAILKRLLNHPRIDLYLKNNQSETPFDVAIRCYCCDDYNNADDIYSRIYSRYMKSQKWVVSNVIRLLIQAMKNQSTSNKAVLSKKYYSETEEEHQQCIANLMVNLRVNGDRDYFTEIMKDFSYPEIVTIINKAHQQTEYYETIARRYQFFKGNNPNTDNPNIDYNKVAAWVYHESDERKLIAMLGNRAMYETSQLGKLPQEIVNEIRFWYSGSFALSRHSFNLKFKVKALEEVSVENKPLP